MILDVLDFSQADEGMIIKYGICDPLDDMKHLYHGLPSFLTKVPGPPGSRRLALWQCADVAAENDQQLF
jgi:hypothetical protein